MHSFEADFWCACLSGDDGGDWPLLLYFGVFGRCGDIAYRDNLSFAVAEKLKGLSLVKKRIAQQIFSEDLQRWGGWAGE